MLIVGDCPKNPNPVGFGKNNPISKHPDYLTNSENVNMFQNLFGSRLYSIKLQKLILLAPPWGPLSTHQPVVGAQFHFVSFVADPSSQARSEPQLTKDDAGLFLKQSSLTPVTPVKFYQTFDTPPAHDKSHLLRCGQLKSR